VIHNKNTAYVQYVDNFLGQETLTSLQETFSNIEFRDVKNEAGVYGKRHTFPLDTFKNDPLLLRIQEFFFPHSPLEPLSISAHLRHNSSGEPKVHVDREKGSIANFLLFVKGKPLFNNGTGFFVDGKLSSHVGFVENRALFFNGNKIWHTDLQAFGDSSPRYTLNIFYKRKGILVTKGENDEKK